MADIATPKQTLAILDQFNLRAKKSLGQNFIIDTNILKNVVDGGKVDENTVVIEIGPGIGALTEQIAKKAKQVYAFEIDSRLIEVLDQTLAPYPNVKVFNQDILQVDLAAFGEKYLKGEDRVVVMANLPYYITTPIIMNFLNQSDYIDDMVFMMQKEVAKRISAVASTKEYGSLSIAIQYYADSDFLFTVPKTVFMPQPNVDSAIIRLSIKDHPDYPVSNPRFLFNLVRGAFAQRRKTLWNNLRNFYQKDVEVLEKVKAVLDQVTIDGSRRGETLTIEEFTRLANGLIDHGLDQEPYLTFSD